MHELLRRVAVLPWNSSVAERYGRVRAGLQSGGRTIGPFDLSIAARALAVGAVGLPVTWPKARWRAAGRPGRVRETVASKTVKPSLRISPYPDTTALSLGLVGPNLTPRCGPNR